MRRDARQVPQVIRIWLLAYFDPGDGMDGAPAGSLFLMPYQSEGSPVSGTARLTQVALVENADRHPAFAIYRK